MLFYLVAAYNRVKTIERGHKIVNKPVSHFLHPDIGGDFWNRGDKGVRFPVLLESLSGILPQIIDQAIIMRSRVSQKFHNAEIADIENWPFILSCGVVEGGKLQ